MSVIFFGSQSTASLVVHWLLIELGIEHELRQLDFDKREQKSPEYLAITPAGRVPTLLIDGQVLTESAAIAMHLADLYPQAKFAPAPGTPARGNYYRWMCFCTYTLMPAYRAWFYPHEPAGERRCSEGAGAPATGSRMAAGGRPPAGRRSVHAGRTGHGGLFDADHADALVTQHAAPERWLAGIGGARPANEGSPGAGRGLPPRRHQRLGLSLAQST